MTLSKTQIENTKYELDENFKKTNLTLEKVAEDLNCSKDYLIAVFNLNSNRLEDPWILKNYLIKVLDEQNIEITPFTALIGKSEDYWFLDSVYVNRGIIE